MLFICIAHPQPVQAAYNRFDNSKFAMLVIDGQTGTVLFQENAGKYRYPASLTKMMTLYLVFDALDRGRLGLNTMMPVSKHAASQSPTKLYLAPGSRISVKDAMMAVAIKSANDAAVVLAEALGGSEYEFALMMTRKARALGMNHTVFRNASGLPDMGQKTTAYDLARLAMALYRDHQKYYYLFSASTYRYKNQTLYTHNRVTVRYRGADGVKTGFINASGFNLVTSAQRGNKRLIGVVLGGRTAAGRDQYMIEMLDKGFRKIAQGGADTVEAFVGKVPTPTSKPNVFLSVDAVSEDQIGQGDASSEIENLSQEEQPAAGEELPTPAVKPQMGGMSGGPSPVRKPRG
jgi:D-alanyl-D-alanine carboxypeptidase